MSELIVLIFGDFFSLIQLLGVQPYPEQWIYDFEGQFLLVVTPNTISLGGDPYPNEIE